MVFGACPVARTHSSCATVNRRQSYTRLISLLVSLAIAGCAPPPPPTPDLVEAWDVIAGKVTASLPDDARRARLRAFASLAMYEGYAADPGSGLRSLAGQVNGLWSVPRPAARSGVDGAIVAAEAQRLVLDSLIAADVRALALVDSLARAQITARRNAGVAADVAERSLLHGASVARTVLSLASMEVARTFVLRHPDECALAPKGAGYTVTTQGTPSPAVAASAATSRAPDLAESIVIEAMERADALAAARSKVRASASPEACVGQRVRGRLQTRLPAR